MIDHSRLLEFHSIEYNPDKARVEIALNYADKSKNALQFVPLNKSNLYTLIQKCNEYL